MFPWKKAAMIAASVLAGIAVILLGLWIYYSNVSWQRMKNIPLSEKEQRLSLVQTAQQWLGCREEDGSHMPIIDLYNSQEILPMNYTMEYTDSWCAAFVTAAAIRAELTDLIPPECGCERQIGLLQDMGIWQEKDTFFPQPGDLIYYAWDEKPFGDCTGWADHVGIVAGTCYPFVKVIEGNKDDCVDYRIVSIWDSTIRGYGTPNYS
ncbi:MAG: hypothetical protein IJA75_01680 [Oscillospiraceae bacterium]|nr:hypothetical protein [Oscillospiraceae bacterium]